MSWETYALVGTLALARLLPVTLLVPYLGGGLVPGPAKLAVAVALAIVLVPGLSEGAPLVAIYASEFALLAIKETAVGLTIGFLGALVFNAVKMAGSLIDTVRGQTLAAALIPGSSERVSPTSALAVPLVVVVYLALDGHHLLIRALAHSFEAIPLTGWPSIELSVGLSIEAIVWQVVRLTGELFAVALAIGLPVLATIFIVDLALGVLGRAIPQVHSFFLGLPIKAMLGIFVLLVGLVVITDVLISEVDRSLDWVRWIVDALAS